MKISFKLEDNEPVAQVIRNISRIEGKKPGDVVKDLVKRYIIELCMKDTFWKNVYCSPMEVRLEA